MLNKELHEIKGNTQEKLEPKIQLSEICSSSKRLPLIVFVLRTNSLQFTNQFSFPNQLFYKVNTFWSEIDTFQFNKIFQLVFFTPYERIMPCARSKGLV